MKRSVRTVLIQHQAEPKLWRRVTVRLSRYLIAMIAVASMAMTAQDVNGQLADHAASNSFALPVQDLVYFGAYWYIIQNSSSAAPFVLGGGYQNPNIVRDLTGKFFSATIEKVDAAGTITDVIFTTHGAKGALDFAASDEIIYNLPCSECDQISAAYDAVWKDPRYADAHIHITGHSLGAGFTQYLLGYALATYGAAATSARADFTQFATPEYGQSIATRFHLPMSAFDGMIYGYVATNDIVLISTSGPEIGSISYFAPYHPIPIIAAAAEDALSAHYPQTYGEALGLPAWLSAQDQAAATAAVLATTTLQNDPTYGPAGGVPLVIQGDSASNVLHGSSGGDVLIGGGGQDVLTGGAGADLFVFNAASESGPDKAHAVVITDFSSSEGDQIDLRGVNSMLGSPQTQNIAFIGDEQFTGVGQLRSWVDHKNTWIAGTFGSDSTPNFFVRLDGVHNLTRADFLLYTASGQRTYHVGYQVY